MRRALATAWRRTWTTVGCAVWGHEDRYVMRGLIYGVKVWLPTSTSPYRMCLRCMRVERSR